MLEARGSDLKALSLTPVGERKVFSLRVVRPPNSSYSGEGSATVRKGPGLFSESHCTIAVRLYVC